MLMMPLLKKAGHSDVTASRLGLRSFAPWALESLDTFIVYVYRYGVRTRTEWPVRWRPLVFVGARNELNWESE